MSRRCLLQCGSIIDMLGTRLLTFDLDLDKLRCHIQLSGVIAAEQSMRSAQLPGFSNQGFNTFRTIRVHHTVLYLVSVHSCSGKEGVFPLLSVPAGHNVWSVVVSCIFVHWVI